MPIEDLGQALLLNVHKPSMNTILYQTCVEVSKYTKYEELCQVLHTSILTHLGRIYNTYTRIKIDANLLPSARSS